MRFQAQTALITGAAGTIGRGIALAFAGSGLRVFVTDLREDPLDALVAEVAAAGGSARALAADATRSSDVRAVVSSAREFFGGPIDALVNVAGVVAQAPVEEIDEEEWDRVFAVNCRGSFLFIKEVVPSMKRARFGRIINFSSKSGKTGSALMAHYSAAKAAVIGLTQALAHELAADGITCNCVCPGITEGTGVWDRVSSGYIENLKLPLEDVVKKFTAKVPLRRLATVDDIAQVVLFLASTGADYMTGQAINITGGREMH
ncbi:MAG: SDR family oxidoreductase [Planctomycetes bacterium]|nr:SDR family oxidoreductase [Planctomycetota bacterium]